MLIDDLSTPALLVDLNRLTDNIERMQAKAVDQGVALRPHAKTHKSPDIARRQRDAGAMGLTVATVDEAEQFVEAGFTDITIAYPMVGRHMHERIRTLRPRATIRFCVDTLEGIAQAAAAYTADDPVEVLLEIDTGHGRCGTAHNSDATVSCARHVIEASSLRLAGVLTHAGQGYSGPQNGETPEEALRRASHQETRRILHAAARIYEEATPQVPKDAFIVSIGSTPTMRFFENAEHEGLRITEIRPGNYVFYDAMQQSLGVCPLDHCALTVYTQVVSRHRAPNGTEKVFLDAGKKVMTTDTGPRTTGFGVPLYNAAYMREHPHAQITNLSEEHGWMQVPGGATMGVGDRLRVVPNHACVTVATQPVLYAVDRDEVMDTWPVLQRQAQAT